MATYRFPRMLTLLAWEEELRRGPYAADRAWLEGDQGDHLHLDFSHVEFADFGALARALLLLDATVRSGIQATVTLPATAILQTSVNTGAGPRLAERRARARGDALIFMRQVGFLQSLQAPHWEKNPVRVLDGAAPGAQEPGAAPGLAESDPHNAPYQPRRVFPFRWLEPMPAVQLREPESFTAVAAGLEDLGLSRLDAQTLSQTVLTELVKNVAEHGSDADRPPVALVGAILLPAETYARRQQGMHGHMAEIAERAFANSSHVLRMIVADSGADRAVRLALSPEPPPGDPGTRRSRQDAIMNALGMRSAVTAGSDSRRIGTSGLGWVARVVRSYHGGVQARTAGLVAALLFGRKLGGTDVVEDGFGYIPGTLLELTLPTGLSLPRVRPAWGNGHVRGKAPDLEWVNCFFDPERGLADTDRTRLSDQLDRSDPDRRADGLIITIPRHDERREIDDRWRGAAHQVLEYVSALARGGLVVVVFPDAEPHVLGPCVAAFNEDLLAIADDDRDPVLVLDCRGEPSWCGGSVPLRAVLALLSECGGVAGLTAAGKRWREAGGEPAGFRVALDAHRHLLDVQAERIVLRLSPPAVHETVARAVRQHVAAAISSGTTGVEIGTFRAPTLRLTNRWISVPALLAATVGTSLAAFILARQVELALRMPGLGDEPTEVFQVGATAGSLARHLSECLSLDGRLHVQPFELHIGQPPIGEQVPAGRKVVLCTDLICTENTVRRAVRMVAGGNAEPLVIACAVDTRGERGPVRLLNRTIPVLSLTEVDVRYSGAAADDVTDIDPLTLRSDQRDLMPAEPADEHDLLTWFAAPDVLRLGHVDEPPSRHYSAFIRLQAMRELEQGDQVTAAVLTEARHAFADIGVQGGQDRIPAGPLAIWYVEADGNAEWLAGTVRDQLTADGCQVDEITQVSRETAGDVWTFPASLASLDKPIGVLIIHWWAITGSTLLQLVRLAAKSGASWIAAVCVLNQMADANDADVLRMMRAVSPPSTATADSRRSSADPARGEVPVSIRFVAASGISAFVPRDCPLCGTRERYRLDQEAAPPPRLLRHAEQLRDTLRPRELDEVARNSAADVFTVPVKPQEATDYLRWRGLLLQARRTVRDRQEVIDRMRALTGEHPPGDEWTSIGLIRLLAAEQHWLQLPPLYFQDGTDLLAQICVSVFEQLTAPLWLRVQALIVMSAAVPHRLVELLPGMLASAGNEAVLVDQMLVDCWRLLRRAPGNVPIDIPQLRHNLQQCRDYLEGQRTGPDAAMADEHLYAVRDLLTVADYRILSKPQDPQDAWGRLREYLVRPVVMHRLEAGLLLVRGFVEDVERVRPSAEAARAAETDWDTCVRQLEGQVLANLPPLRQVMAGDFVADWLGRRDQLRLLTLARPDVGELRAVTNRLHTLAHGAWRPDDPAWRAVRRELLDRINWWHRIFLAAHLADHQMRALLVELIRSAPVRPWSYLAKLRDSRAVAVTETGIEFSGLEVFCPGKLLEQVVTHLGENLDRHQVPGAACRLHVAYERPEGDTIRIVVRNSGTAPREPHGHGIEALNDKLGAFGGSLRGQEFAENGWTFAAEVKLALWHGG
jgi:adenine/guanine phosphoribosyltransferase-like PRPP-binding protein